jgi:hypothetical protein
MKIKQYLLGVIGLTLLISAPLKAQQKNLTPADYAQWQQIYSTAFSDDGNWFS